ncbi:MAG: hypothetical protein J7502_11220, partial [Flavisolibacter sp.]|nr:hypothetical protein [Flavisolibacter sp.]
MRSTLTKKLFFSILLVSSSIALIRCTDSSGAEPEWGAKNKELIAQHNLTVRKISGLPKISVESNLEAAKVKGLSSLDSAELHPGVQAKLFWGSGTMISVLQLAPNAKIPEETLPADRFVFVLEGSIDQTINGAP